MKHGRSIVAAAVAAAAAMSGAYLGASEKIHFDSYMNDGPITIDGPQNEWTGAMQPFGQAPVSVQVAHDNDFVYVRLASSDPGSRMELTRLGLIAWFDPRGGTKKALGIHFPVFEQGKGGEEGRGREGGYGGRGGYGRGGGERHRGGRDGEGNDPEAFSPPDRVDILGPGKDDARSLTREHLQGIEVAMAVEQGTVLYELKVPLAPSADHPYAIGARVGDTIGFGLETPKLEMPMGGREGGHGGGMGGFGGGMGGGGRGGHGGGGGYGGHGGRGGGEGREEFQPPKPVKGWATVTLK